MPSWLQEILVCPSCRVGLGHANDTFSCERCGKSYPVRNGIVSFVTDDGYCGSFGQQWNTFRRAQIDGFSKTTESQDRFASETGWTREQLAGRLVLDGGCGAGRFADIALQHGARVVAVDVSSAVVACRQNLEDLGHAPEQYAVVQASLYDLPFRPGTFDYVYSIGVLQHTPDRRRAVRALAAQLGRGEIALWVYERSWRSLVGYKYWFRLLSSRLSEEANWRFSAALVNTFFPLGWLLWKVPHAGRYLVRFLPMAFRSPGPAVTREQSKELSLLDTFDNLAPAYDSPMTEAQLAGWMQEAGLTNITRRRTPSLALVAAKAVSDR